MNQNSKNEDKKSKTIRLKAEIKEESESDDDLALISGQFNKIIKKFSNNNKYMRFRGQLEQ